MLKFLVIAAALFLMWKLFTGDQKKKKDQAMKEKQNMAKSGEMVKDPICGTYVKKDSDIRVKEGDKVHCFCSFECREKYLKSIGAATPQEQQEAEKEKEES